MRIDILFISTILVVCYALLFWNIIEGYDTEVELDIRGDEEGNIILSEEEKMKRKEKIEEKKLNHNITNYEKLLQLRQTEESNKREADYGVANVTATVNNPDPITFESELVGRELAYGAEQTSPH